MRFWRGSSVISFLGQIIILLGLSAIIHETLHSQYALALMESKSKVASFEWNGACR